VSTAFSTVQRAPSPFSRPLTPVTTPPARQSGVLPLVAPPLVARPAAPLMMKPPSAPPAAPPLPRSTAERMVIAKDRIRAAAEAGQRIRSYEVALDVDLSEFHFARQFRAAFGRSPHVYYDEVRAEKARALLADGMGEGEVARRIGFRRPAELRALLAKRRAPNSETA
jgi:AraC-like DNA-binding protein